MANVEVPRGVGEHGELVPLGFVGVFANAVEGVGGPAILPLGLYGCGVVSEGHLAPRFPVLMRRVHAMGKINTGRGEVQGEGPIREVSGTPGFYSVVGFSVSVLFVLGGLAMEDARRTKGRCDGRGRRLYGSNGTRTSPSKGREREQERLPSPGYQGRVMRPRREDVASPTSRGWDSRLEPRACARAFGVGRGVESSRSGLGGFPVVFGSSFVECGLCSNEAIIARRLVESRGSGGGFLGGYLLSAY